MNARTLFFVIPAMLVTAVLFFVMAFFLQQKKDGFDQRYNPVDLDFLMPEREIETLLQVKKPLKPELEKEPPALLPEFSSNFPEMSALKTQIELPVFKPDINIALNLPTLSGDNDYFPILKVAPLYPPRASKRNIEGYVIVEYSISENGQVFNVKVIEANPPGVFDQSAIEAARKFKYKPRRQNDQAVVVNGVKNRFTFRLEE